MRVLENEVGVKILSEERQECSVRYDESVRQICYIHIEGVLVETSNNSRLDSKPAIFHIKRGLMVV